MYRIKVTRQRVVAWIGFIMSSLLVFAASCSSNNQAKEDSSVKKTEKVVVQNQPSEDVVKQVATEHSGNGKSRGKKEEIVVANQFCAVCHYGFSDEKMAARHAKAGIGCERCHGESARHRSDEDNITPPELMYPKERINPTCMMCHPRHDIIHVKHHKSFLEGAETIFDPEIDDASARSAGPKEVCTDCHAEEHRIKVRTIRWDKCTGEIIKD